MRRSMQVQTVGKRDLSPSASAGKIRAEKLSGSRGRSPKKNMKKLGRDLNSQGAERGKGGEGTQRNEA